MKEKYLDTMSEVWKDVMERHLGMFEHLFRPPDCADGWAPFIEKLMTDIERVLEGLDEADSKDIGFEVHQIKEKFGGLRFYAEAAVPKPRELSPGLSDAVDRINELIAEAESNSFTICEKCGEPGELRMEGRSWIRTLCDEHAEEG